MVQFVTHPWRYRSELLSIRQRLYPDHYPESGSREVVATSNLAAADVGDADPEGAGKQATAQERRRRRQIQKDAVAEIHAWIERGECPHLVESTSRLVAAALADEEMLEQQAERRARLRLQDGQGAASHETMKAELPDADASVVAAAYALAFARFVTNLLDSQQAFEHKASMFSLAATVGIPASFVALRHQISHEPLPSLPVLRNACRRALMWIREHYWDRLLLTSWSSRHPTGSRRNAENEAAAAAIRERIVRALEGGEGAHDWTALVLGEGSSRTELPVLLLALDEVENGLRDLKALSKLTRLRRALLMQAERNGDATGSENVDEMEVDREPLKDIDKAREKLESAKRQLDRMQQEDVEADVNLPAPTGWIKHEGPWRPRPIGELIV